MRARFLKEVAGLGLPRAPDPAPPAITEDDLASMPDAVRRYLHFMGVAGRPRGFSLRLGWAGGFRMKQGGPFLPCEAWQYNTRLGVTRYFKMRLRFGHVLPVIARDTYMEGHGRMLGKAFDLVPVVDGTGVELDIGELVTYLNDAILFAPSMLLGSETAWAGVSDNSFDVAFTDRGRTVSARVFLDDRGAPVDFSTTDRFFQRPEDPEHHWLRMRWTTPVDAWDMAGGRPVPTHGQAVWQLPEGPFAYADFRVIPGSPAFDVAPGE